MRCRALALALLLSGAAWADGPAIDVKAGQPAPSDGVFLPAQAARDVAKKCARAEADRDKYRSQVADAPLPSGSVLLTVSLVSLAVGVLVGGFAVAVARR